MKKLYLDLNAVFEDLQKVADEKNAELGADILEPVITSIYYQCLPKKEISKYLSYETHNMLSAYYCNDNCVGIEKYIVEVED